MTFAASRRPYLLGLSACAALLLACGASSPVETVPVTGEAPLATAPFVAEGSAAPPAPQLAAPQRESAPHTPRGPVPAAWGAAPRMRATAAQPPGASAAAVLVLDDASGAVLYHDNGRTSFPPASLTKIATAILAIELGNLDAWVTTDVDSRVMRGSTVMGLVPGDEFTVRDLLYGMMLPSGNDAALALGRHVAGSDAAFVERMNALVARLGLTETRFANPHGLNNAEHYASAYDLALLARYAMTLPDFRAVVGTTAWIARGSRALPMYNVMSGVLYSVPGADGVKSGYTRQAGRTLLTSAVREGRRLFVVVLNDPQREADSAALLNWAFDAFEWTPQTVSDAGASPATSGG